MSITKQPFEDLEIIRTNLETEKQIKEQKAILLKPTPNTRNGLIKE